jgi:1,4-alpha-glucan branching enzyme
MATKKVKFALSAEIVGDATSGLVLGDFNGWDQSKAAVLKKVRGGGMSVQLDLETGKSYEYRYLLSDGRWVNDTNADAYAKDPRYGIENCVINLAEPKKSAPRKSTATAKTKAPVEKAPVAAKATATPKASAAKKTSTAKKDTTTTRAKRAPKSK